jgi:hypothetical protein
VLGYYTVSFALLRKKNHTLPSSLYTYDICCRKFIVIFRELFIVAGNRILVFEEVKTNKDIVEHQLPLTAQTLI